MNTRMQPVGIVFNKFNRIVRDLSKKLEKKVELELEGTDVELDKSILELLSDPLTHLIRNALDHGIEVPAVREEKGKPVVGQISLRAFHEGGQVHIEIEDDGAGIDPEKLRQIAVERGLHTRDEVEGMSDNEARMLIFAPGFSTAKEVSDVSGRGVGMDVVKTNISKLGGKIDIESEMGMGSVLRIRLPLTLAIIPSLIVEVASERYAIPQVNLVELVRVKSSDRKEAIAEVRGAPVLKLRGRLLPLVDLKEMLGSDEESAEHAPEVAADEDAEAAEGARATHVVVLQVGEARFGLVVDGVSDSEEIVVKPLSRMLESCGVYAGAAIMGDGHPAMILDAGGLAAHAMLELDSDARKKAKVELGDGGASKQLVLFTNASDERFGVPLESLLRLEKIEASQIEQVGDQECIQYRGEGLPLTKLEHLLPVRPVEMVDDHLYVLIPRTEGRAVGLLAGSIIDTVETSVRVQREEGDPDAVTGRALIQGKLTMLLDTEALLRTMEAA